MSRSNVSNHLGCLRGCGLVVATPEGRQMRYDLADPHLRHALSDLLDVILAVDTARPCPVETGTASSRSDRKVLPSPC